MTKKLDKQVSVPRGRPVKNTMPAPIPDTPENIARAIMRGPPKKKWDYLKAAKARDSTDG